MPDYLPLYHDGNGESTPYTAGATITGGQLLEFSADRTVAPATATSTKVAGVAAYDAQAGDLLTTYRGGVQLLKAAGAIAVGDMVVAAANGAVATSATPAAGTKVGKAQAAAADGALAEIIWEEN